MLEQELSSTRPSGSSDSRQHTYAYFGMTLINLLCTALVSLARLDFSVSQSLALLMVIVLTILVEAGIGWVSQHFWV
jgi:hypothetical protein